MDTTTSSISSLSSPLPSSMVNVNVDWHPFEFSFEREFRWEQWGPSLYIAFPAAVAISLFYVAAVFGGQRFMSKRKAFDLSGALIYWNGFLTVLSWIMALRLVPAMIARIRHWSFEKTICDQSFSDGTTGFWVLIFTASKVPELIDTAFLVLRKRTVILLHWYHHFSVLLYNWYAYSVRMPAGLWFSAMNSFVHAFMYLYYFQTARGKKPSWNIFLTLTQIAQMVVGSYLTARDLLSEHCAPLSSTYTGVIMYFSYFLLFVHLFYEMYIKTGGKSSRRGPKSKPAPPVIIDASSITTPTPTTTTTTTCTNDTTCNNNDTTKKDL